MSILNPNDFIGKYNISKNQLNLTPLQTCIDSVEFKIMNQLFGVELLALYTQGIEDDEEIYTVLFDQLVFEYNDNQYISNGITEMLKGFTYYAFFVETTTQASTNGNVIESSENSRMANDVETNIYLRYNEAVNTFNAIQTYLFVNSDVYPTFKGIKKRLMTWF